MKHVDAIIEATEYMALYIIVMVLENNTHLMKLLIEVLALQDLIDTKYQ